MNKWRKQRRRQTVEEFLGIAVNNYDQVRITPAVDRPPVAMEVGAKGDRDGA